MIKLNPEIVNQEKIRKQKRKRLLKTVAIPTIVLFITGAFLVRTGIYNIAFSLSYSNSHLDNALTVNTLQKIINTISPYLVHYNDGVAYLTNNEYQDAEASFRTSLRMDPPKSVICKISVNLSLSIELQADVFSENEDYEKALELYNTAEMVLFNNNCASRMTNGQNKDENAGAAKERIIDKRNKTTMDMNEVEDQKRSGDGDSSDKYSEITPEEMEKIKGNGEYDYIYGKVWQNGIGRGASSSNDGGAKW